MDGSGLRIRDVERQTALDAVGRISGICCRVTVRVQGRILDQLCLYLSLPSNPRRANEAERLVGPTHQLYPQELKDHQVPWLGGSLSGQSPGHPRPGAVYLLDLWPPLLYVAGVLPSIYISGYVTLVSMLSRTGEGVWGSGGEVGGTSLILPPCPSKPTHSGSCSHRVSAFFCVNELVPSFW